MRAIIPTRDTLGTFRLTKFVSSIHVLYLQGSIIPHILLIVSDKSKTDKKDSNAAKDDSSGTLFQKQRVDMLLAELLRKFPPPIPPMLQNLQQPLQVGPGADVGMGANSAENNAIGPLDVATESIDMKPPPEKKTK